jgi:hypothetical protein
VRVSRFWTRRSTSPTGTTPAEGNAAQRQRAADAAAPAPERTVYTAARHGARADPVLAAVTAALEAAVGRRG